MTEELLSLADVSERFQISFMGEGEPLIDSRQLFSFCEITSELYSDVVFGISTVGVARGIDDLISRSWGVKVKLQVSLHAWPPSKRRKIIPVEDRFPVIDALRSSNRFAERFRTRVCLNCVLFDGLNDSHQDALRIARIAKSGSFYVKISEFNRNGSSALRGAPEHRVRAFCNTLAEVGVEYHRFKSLGTIIGAGCGQISLQRLHSMGNGSTDNMPKKPVVLW
jgi:adenine C2-methylase RlmN of 23S rRNA A2503 and tRNA A37